MLRITGDHKACKAGIYIHRRRKGCKRHYLLRAAILLKSLPLGYRSMASGNVCGPGGKVDFGGLPRRRRRLNLQVDERRGEGTKAFDSVHNA